MYYFYSSEGSPDERIAIIEEAFKLVSYCPLMDWKGIHFSKRSGIFVIPHTRSKRYG